MSIVKVLDRALLVLLSGAVLALSGCATRVTPFLPHADWERGADLSPGKSFAVVPSPLLPEYLDEDQKKLAAVIESVIQDELTRKGYKSVPAEGAELVVSFHALRQQRRKMESQSEGCAATGELDAFINGAQPHSMMLSCEESIVTSYDEGTLIIDIYDAKSKMLLWHGWASGEAPDRRAEGTPGFVGDVTASILAYFPPRRAP